MEFLEFLLPDKNSKINRIPLFIETIFVIYISGLYGSRNSHSLLSYFIVLFCKLDVFIYCIIDFFKTNYGNVKISRCFCLVLLGLTFTLYLFVMVLENIIKIR